MEPGARQTPPHFDDASLEWSRIEAGRIIAEAERIKADAEAEASQTRIEAVRESSRMREEAAAEAVEFRSETAEYVDRMRREVAEEVARLSEESRAEADRLVAEAESRARALVDQAREQGHFEANRIREEAELEARRAEEEREARTRRVAGTVTPIHSSEISVREFPKAWRGVDGEAVREWLRLVEQSQVILEDELDRARSQWDEAVRVLTSAKERLVHQAVLGNAGPDDDLDVAIAWGQALEALAGANVRTGASFDTTLVKVALLDTPLPSRPFGFAREATIRRMEAAARQLTRLQNQVALLREENEDMRSRLLKHLAEPLPATPLARHRRELEPAALPAPRPEAVLSDGGDAHP